MDDFNKHLSTYCDTRLQELRHKGEVERLFSFEEVAANPVVISVALLLGLLLVTALTWWVF